MILGSWLLLFRSDRTERDALRWVAGITGLAVACHPSHLGLIGGLLICAVALKLARRSWRLCRRPICARRGLALAVALGLIVVGNFAMTGSLFISRSGSVFVFARLMQDGIVQKLMDDTCPPSGDTAWKLCAYRGKLPCNANAWLWGDQSALPCPGRLQRPGPAGRRQPHHRRKPEALSLAEHQDGGL